MSRYDNTSQLWHNSWHGFEYIPGHGWHGIYMINDIAGMDYMTLEIAVVGMHHHHQESRSSVSIVQVPGHHSAKVISTLYYHVS